MPNLQQHLAKKKANRLSDMVKDAVKAKPVRGTIKKVRVILPDENEYFEGKIIADKNAKIHPKLKTGTVVYEGKFIITGPNTVKRVPVKKKPTKEFIDNFSIEALDEESATVNTMVLFDFLKKKLIDAVVKEDRKGKYIRSCGYNIRYSSHGFLIHDVMNFKTCVNVNEYHNDFRTPEDVAEFIVKTSVRSTPAQREYEEKVEIGDKLKSLGKVKIIPPYNPLKVMPSLSKLPKEVSMKRINEFFASFVEKQIELEELKKKVFSYTDDKVLKIRMGKLISGVTRRNALKILPELEKLYMEYDPAKLKKAPKFVGVTHDYDSIVDLTHETTPEGTVMLSLHKLNSSKKMVVETEPLQTFMWKNALALYPKAMQYLMKIAEGKIKHHFQDAEKIEYTIKDLQVEFSPKVLNAPADFDNFIQACDDLICYCEATTAINVNFSGVPPKGTKVRVYWPCYFKWFYGVVIDSKKIRYEDGEVLPLLKSQRIGSYN